MRAPFDWRASDKRSYLEVNRLLLGVGKGLRRSGPFDFEARDPVWRRVGADATVSGAPLN